MSDNFMENSGDAYFTGLHPDNQELRDMHFDGPLEPIYNALHAYLCCKLSDERMQNVANDIDHITKDSEGSDLWKRDRALHKIGQFGRPIVAGAVLLELVACGSNYLEKRFDACMENPPGPAREACMKEVDELYIKQQETKKEEAKEGVAFYQSAMSLGNDGASKKDLPPGAGSPRTEQKSSRQDYFTPPAQSKKVRPYIPLGNNMKIPMNAQWAPNAERASDTTIITFEGGKIDAPVSGGHSFSDGWRSFEKTSVSVREGQQTKIRLSRGGYKSGYEIVYVLRLNGIIYVAERKMRIGLNGQVDATIGKVWVLGHNDDATVSGNDLLKVGISTKDP